MKVPTQVKALFKDVDNLDKLNEKALAKLKCELWHGQRIYWYYKEDATFAEEEDLDVREMRYYSGLVIGLEDKEPGLLDPWDCMIVIDSYPCEKCGPEISWVAPSRLLTSNDLVEVYQIEEDER